MKTREFSDGKGDPLTFGEWVRKERERRGWSREELARRSGLSPIGLYNIESGNTASPRQATQRAIEKALLVEFGMHSKPARRSQESVAELIDRALERLELTQGALGAKLGVSQPTVSNWLGGRGEPSDEQIEAIRELLGEKEDARTFGQWVREQREKKRWSCAALAEKAGLSVPGIYNIESGKIANPRQKTKEALEKALNGKVPDATEREIEEAARVVGMGELTDFDPHQEDELPELPGVYVFYDVCRRPVYVGMSENIKRRILGYARGTSKRWWFEKPLVETGAYIEIEDKDMRAKVESLLIAFLKTNALLNKNKVDRSD